MQGSDDNEAFTPEEAAYFNSGGQSSPVPEVASAGDAGKQSDGGKPTAGGEGGAAGVSADSGQDGLEPGEVELNGDGRVRDGKTGRYIPLPVLQREREATESLEAENAQLRARMDGIAANRIQTVGYGESKPVANNDTETGKAKNRRTEVRVVE